MSEFADVLGLHAIHAPHVPAGLPHDVLEVREQAGGAAMALLEGCGQEQAIRDCLPPGCALSILGADGGLTASVHIIDRAPVPSIRGGMVLHLRWNTDENTVSLNGETIPLSALAAKLETYDRSVNWSATQGLVA